LRWRADRISILGSAFQILLALDIGAEEISLVLDGCHDN